MSQKPSSTTITSTEVREMLRTAAEKLSAREEKALRLRSGVGLARTETLPQRGQANADARAELAALEIELIGKLAARKGTTGPHAKTSAAAQAVAAAASKSSQTTAAESPVRSKEKDKIIRALRRLK